MKSKTVKEKDHAWDQAKAQLESIQEMVEAVKDARESDHIDAETTREAAERTIQEDALEVSVRSNWHTPGDKDNTYDDEYLILLCTGGPACRIIGDLSEHNEPKTAHLEYQGWGTPWTEYRLTREEEETVLTYARCFYFGD